MHADSPDDEGRVACPKRLGGGGVKSVPRALQAYRVVLTGVKAGAEALIQRRETISLREKPMALGPFPTARERNVSQWLKNFLIECLSRCLSIM